jgi:ketosteroid isomerase-like protein
MQSKTNLQIVESWMSSLATGDQETFWQIHADDVIYNISGHSVISGQVRGREKMMEDIVPHVFSGLNLERSRFATKWKVMCDDGSRIVTIMEADCHGVNGVQYDQRYLHIFGFCGGQISEVWEFFDTDLANRVLFTPEHAVPRAEGIGDFDF